MTEMYLNMFSVSGNMVLALFSGYAGPTLVHKRVRHDKCTWSCLQYTILFRYIVDHVNFKNPLIDCFTGVDVTTDDYRCQNIGLTFLCFNHIDLFRVPFGIADLLFIGLIIFIFFFLEVSFLQSYDISSS